MFDRFTDRAKKVMNLARQEAQRFNHEYLGTEHILLGLVQEGSGVAANVLKNLDVELRKIRVEVEKIVKNGTNMVTMGQLPFTPRAKKVLELALEEAQNLGHNYIGTEHLLLGLIRENEGIAAQVLMNLGTKLEEVREEVLELLGADQGDAAGGGAPEFHRALTGSFWSLPLLGINALAAICAGIFLLRRAYRLARACAAAQMTLLLAGWGLAQYPFLIRPDLTIRAAAASPAMLRLLLAVLGAGALLLFPAIFLLLRVFKKEALFGR